MLAVVIGPHSASQLLLFGSACAFKQTRKFEKQEQTEWLQRNDSVGRVKEERSEYEARSSDLIDDGGIFEAAEGNRHEGGILRLNDRGA